MLFITTLQSCAFILFIFTILNLIGSFYLDVAKKFSLIFTKIIPELKNFPSLLFNTVKMQQKVI